MLTKGTGFARYSKGLCFFVSLIWLVLAVLSFTSGSENSTINGFLWLAGALAFAISGMTLGRSSGNEAPASTEASD
ncbi:MAG: hypothetical protein MI746_07910 [Pseudomonadales bacterium]|nr:hypothetical protein [Pseudomonadales bacterium]